MTQLNNTYLILPVVNPTAYVLFLGVVLLSLAELNILRSKKQARFI